MKTTIQKISAFAMALFIAITASAQTPQWLFPINPSNPVESIPFPGSPSNTNFNVGVSTGNMITDAAGNRLFAVIDQFGQDEVNGQFGEMIYYETRTFGSPRKISVSPHGFTEKIVVPVPDGSGGVDCNRYYVIQGGDWYDRNWEYDVSGTLSLPVPTTPDVEPYYSIVNMNTNNHDQYLESFGTKTDGTTTYTLTAKPLMDLVPGLYSANTSNPYIYSANTVMGLSKLRSDNTYFLFVLYNRFLYRFVVSSTGISYGSLVTTLTGTNSTPGAVGGELEVYDMANGNYRIATSHFYVGNNPQLFMCELNSSGVIQSSPAPSTITLPGTVPTIPAIHGIEFSPDGNTVYVSHETNSSTTQPLEYCTFGASSLSTLGATPSNKANFAKGMIEWNRESGTDYLYFASATELGRLASPNSPTSTTTWSVVANSASGYSNSLNYSDYYASSPPPISYTLPDYIDRYDYLSGYQAGECCLEYKATFNVKEDITLPAMVGGSSTYTISAGNIYTCTTASSGTVAVAITSTTTINGNITVPNGVKVTFSNLRMEFTPHAALIVNSTMVTAQQGGKVVLGNSTLTAFNSCDANAMWPGIYLHGNDVINQGSTTSSQNAVLTVSGISQIDHALTAIYIEYGAIAQFPGNLYDNKVAVEASTYTNLTTNDVSLFQNTKFKTQSTYLTSLGSPSYFVGITDRKTRIRFLSCTFSNDATAFNNVYDGVVTNNSAFFTTGSTFTRLNYGVRHSATNIAAGGIATVSGGTFTNNNVGVAISNSNLCAVGTNTFNVLDNTSSFSTPTGLLLDAASRFAVSANIFRNNSLNTATGPGVTMGIHAINTCINEQAFGFVNIIEACTFSKLTVGIQNDGVNYWQKNSTPSNDRGLRFYCNNFTGGNIGVFDIGVSSGIIDNHQGVTNWGAQNQFSHTGTFGDLWIDLAGIPTFTPTPSIGYIYNNAGTAYVPVISISSSTSISTAVTANTDNDCTSTSVGSPGGRMYDTDGNPELWLSRIAELQDLIDEASEGEMDQGTLDNIANWEGRQDQMRTKLILWYVDDTSATATMDSAYKYMLQFARGDKHQLIGVYLAMGDLQSAQDVYDELHAEQPGSNLDKYLHILVDLYGKDARAELLSDTVLYNHVLELANDSSDRSVCNMSRWMLNKINLNTYRPYFDVQLPASGERKLNPEENNESAYRLGNHPNPFNGSTTITANIPKGTTTAAIVVTDVLGKEVTSFKLAEGNNSVTFEKQDASGLLFYTLYVDGVRKETRLMMKSGQ